MSGIAGVYYLDDRPVQADTVRNMIQPMEHRGPDAQRAWAAGPVGLGHCMLHTTPESLHERLPYSDAESGLTITADARIDNRDELFSALRVRPEPGQSVPDSTLILRAYEKWGEDCVDHLVGAFAFALWDEENRKLLCARDPMGIRPFYYHVRDRMVAFGSEIKALLALDQVPRRFNETRMLDLLLRIQVDREATIYRDVLRLPPGHLLAVRSDRVNVRRYWTLTPAEVPNLTDAEYAEQFRDLFTESVRCRTRSAFPVGADLSGGLDSSAVACMARDVLPDEAGEPLHTFSYLFDRAPESDEREYAQAVLDQGGFKPHWLSGDTRGPLSDLNAVYQVIDDYLVGGMHYMIWASYEKAREAGVRVMLNGFDGDTTVGHGTLYLKELAKTGQWKQFAQEITMLARRYAEADHKQPFEEMYSSVGALFRQYAHPQLKSLAERNNWLRFARAVRALSTYFTVSPWQLVRQHWRSLLLPRSGRSESGLARDAPVTASLLRDEVVKRCDVRDRIQRFHDQRATMFDSAREKQRVQLLLPAVSEGLEVMNHYGARFGVEPRLPFMDVRLIRYCLGLPPDQSLKEGWTRIVLRRAMDDVLPSEVCWRVGKARMFAANRRALQETNASELEAYLTDLGAVEQYIDMDYLGDVYEHRGELKPQDLILLQRVATLSVWISNQFSDSGTMYPESSWTSA